MATSHPRALTFLDPTSMLGHELAERIVELRPDVRRSYFHTSGSDEHLILEAAGEASLVPPLADVADLEGSAVVVVTARPPAGTTDRILAWLRANPSVGLVDLTDGGLSPSESAVVFDRLPQPGGGRWMRLLDPSLVGAAWFIRALSSLGPEEVHATTLSPASAFGEGAIAELVSQGIARLSGRQPDRPAALPSVLAFDLAAAPDHARIELERQLSEIFPTVTTHLRPLNAGVFHGNLTTLAIRVRTVPGIDRLRALLRESPSLRLVRRNETLQSSDAVGSQEVSCSDVTVARPWVLATLTADGLRLATVRLAADLLSSLIERQAAGAAAIQ